MRGFFPIFKRELFAFFVTPLAWVLIVAFLVVQGMHFYLLVDHFSSSVDVMSDQSPIQAFFGNTVILYLVLFLFVPPMTMRLFAEERRSGTAETLMTAPVSTLGVVLGKYAAALVTYVVMWLPTVLYLVILGRAGPIDVRVVAASYGGVVLMGAGYLAIGLMMSALTDSQFIALVLSALVNLVLFVLGIGEFVTAEGSTLNALCSYVSVWSAMTEVATGVIDSRRIAFGVSLVVLPLFVCTRAVDAWRRA